jgi:hypothetical protein
LGSKHALVVGKPPALHHKIGRVGRVSPMMVARAEAALQKLSVHFAAWLAEEIELLDKARIRARKEGFNAETAEALNVRAHDMKSLGATYGFPVITDIAGSLCRLLEEPETRMTAPFYLIDAHIDAIAAAVRDNVRSRTDPIGRALVGELDGLVRKVA